MTQKRVIAAVAIAVVVVVGIILYLLLSEPKPRNLEDEWMRSVKDPTMQQVGEDGKMMLVVDDDPQSVLNYYVQWSQYPPNSRPLSADDVDKLQPYSLNTVPLPVVNTMPSDCITNDNGEVSCKNPATFLPIQCKMEADKIITIGTGDFSIRLFCVDEGNKRVKIESLTAKMFNDTATGQEIPSKFPPIHIGDDGSGGDATSGDLIYTITVRPTKTDWGNMFVEAKFKVGGKETDQRFTWYNTPHVIAEFQGKPTDRMKDGSLVVDVPVQIHKAGYYTFAANLQEKNDPQRFLATATFEGKLSVGRQVVPLRFFGKILRDQNVDGPYIVREIRGQRDNSGVTPDMVEKSFETGETLTTDSTEPFLEFMSIAPNYETESYDAKMFSKEEWTSDERKNRINYLEQRLKEQG